MNEAAWGEDAVQEVLSWGKWRRSWVQVRTELVFVSLPIFGLTTRAVRTMLLAAACGRGPEIGLPAEEHAAFNNAAYYLQRTLRVTDEELETLYREGMGLAYQSTSRNRHTPTLRLCVAVRHMAAHPILAGEKLEEANLPPAEMAIAQRIAALVRGGAWNPSEEDPRTLVAAALELLGLSPEEDEVLAVLQRDKDSTRPPWAGLLDDIRAARELLR